MCVITVSLVIFYFVFYVSLGLFFTAVWFTWFRIILNADDPIYSGDDGLASSPGVYF